jgi:arylsulfatase A-like enzyme
MYENALHIPMVVRYPGLVQEGSTNDRLVSMLDMAPTFLDLAGAEIPGDMQGESFLPLLRADESGWRESVYYHFYEAFHVPEQHGVRTETHKLVYYPTLDQDHRWEIFDLEADPLEMHNACGDPEIETITIELKELLQSHMEHYGDRVG